MIGTIGSTVWYEWGGEVGIAAICAIANVGVSCIVVLLWIAHKQHPYLPTEPEQQKEQQILHSPLRALSSKAIMIHKKKRKVMQHPIFLIILLLSMMWMQEMKMQNYYRIWKR